jgi:hypothetical protein
MRYRQLRARLAELDRRLPAHPTPQASLELMRIRQIDRRLSRLIRKASPLFTEQEADKVAQGLQAWLETGSGPYRWWFKKLGQGHCRLPVLSPESMRELLLAWLSPACDTLMPVCRHCGMLYPQPRRPPLREWKLLPGKVPGVGPPPWYDLPEFFHSCPGCGASPREIDWAHLMDEINRPWMEMDGYVGRVLHSGQAAIH